jgi:Mn2+/Fe2+ NRAMP family transporter
MATRRRPAEGQGQLRPLPGTSPPLAHEDGGSWHLLGILGPGLITGAADDDPSGIATYSQTGAQFSCGQLWTALWMPLVTGVQEACGRIGNVTGRGLAGNIKNPCRPQTLWLLLTLVAPANTINIGADLGTIGADAFAPHQRRCFYGVIAVSIMLGQCLNFTGVNPIRFLVFAAVLNGVGAIPLLWIVDRITADRAVMGTATSSRLSRVVMAVTFLGIAGSVAGVALSLFTN